MKILYAYIILNRVVSSIIVFSVRFGILLLTELKKLVRNLGDADDSPIPLSLNSSLAKIIAAH